MDTSEAAWRAGLRATIDGRTPPGLALQPIVDLRRGVVVGHEVLARFPGPPATSPDRWFAAAERHGCGPALTVAVLEPALALLPSLPTDTFLTVNLEPAHVFDPAVRAALLTSGRLDRVVVELTEHAAIDDLGGLLEHLDVLRGAGARTAIDDAGSGYAGLQAILRLRPDFIKLDRSLVEGLDRDPARRILLRALGEIADAVDAWVLGEGIETHGELEELVAAGVPLGQGYLLGRPAPQFTDEVSTSVLEAIIARLRVLEQRDLLVTLLERPTEQIGDLLVFADGVSVEIDDFRRPVALRHIGQASENALLLAKPSDALREVAGRVVARVGGAWSDPVIVTDGRGTAVGIVRVARLLERLATTTQPAGEPAG